MSETWKPGSCADRFFDLEGTELVEVPVSEAYGRGVPYGRYLRASYEGGPFIIYRVPLPEFVNDTGLVEEVRRRLEGEASNYRVQREGPGGGRFYIEVADEEGGRWRLDPDKSGDVRPAVTG